MRIGILTGGGDVPGLNPCIKAVVERVTEEGHEVLGLRRGWGALLNFDIADDKASREQFTMQLDQAAVRTIDRTGGTVLHTSRTNPGRVRPQDVPSHLADRIDGGEGSEVVVDLGITGIEEGPVGIGEIRLEGNMGDVIRKKGEKRRIRRSLLDEGDCLVRDLVGQKPLGRNPLSVPEQGR